MLALPQGSPCCRATLRPHVAAEPNDIYFSWSACDSQPAGAASYCAPLQAWCCCPLSQQRQHALVTSHMLQDCGLPCTHERQLELLANFSLPQSAGSFALGATISMGNGSSTMVVLNGTVTAGSHGLAVTQVGCQASSGPDASRLASGQAPVLTDAAGGRPAAQHALTLAGTHSAASAHRSCLPGCTLAARQAVRPPVWIAPAEGLGAARPMQLARCSRRRAWAPQLRHGLCRRASSWTAPEQGPTATPRPRAAQCLCQPPACPWKSRCSCRSLSTGAPAMARLQTRWPCLLAERSENRSRRLRAAQAQGPLLHNTYAAAGSKCSPR